jgi:hypothetical protein
VVVGDEDRDGTGSLRDDEVDDRARVLKVHAAILHDSSAARSSNAQFGTTMTRR